MAWAPPRQLTSAAHVFLKQQSALASRDFREVEAVDALHVRITLWRNSLIDGIG